MDYRDGKCNELNTAPTVDVKQCSTHSDTFHDFAGCRGHYLGCVFYNMSDEVESLEILSFDFLAERELALLA